MKRFLELALVVALVVPATFAHEPSTRSGKKAKNPPAVANAGKVRAAAANTASVSNVACYFGSTWEWALTPSNAYYSMNGSWVSSKVGTVFSTGTSPSEIVAACAQAKTYYKVSGTFSGAYAATSNVGSNYAIINSALIP